MTERTLSLAASKNLAQNIGFLSWARVFGALLLLGWMLLSLLWSHAPLQQTFISIWEYRKLVYVPLWFFCLQTLSGAMQPSKFGWKQVFAKS